MDPKIVKKIRALMKKYDTKYADVFDLDGTLFDGDILQSLVLSLSNHNLPALNSKFYEVVPKLLGSPDPVNAAGQSLVYRSKIQKKESIELVESGLFVGLPVDEVKEVVYLGIDQILNKRISFTQNLVLALRRRKPRRLIVCITGTPQEIADILAPLFGIDVTIGCQYAKKGGIYVKGKSNLDAGLHKGKIMDELTKAYGLSCEDGIAAGDGIFDLEMFERVRYPIAVNPNKKLQQEVRSKRNVKWNNESIAWVDQTHNQSNNHIHCWVPNRMGLLQESDAQLIIPDLGNNMNDVLDDISSKWFHK